MPISANFQLFVRVASVNAKGLILSDLHIINSSLLNYRLIPRIEKFKCFTNDQNQFLTIQWSISHQSNLQIEKYRLYYSDLTQKSDDFIRVLTFATHQISIDHQSTHDVLKYEFNVSLLNLNYNDYHTLRLYLSIMDQNQNQLFNISSPIYCTFTRKPGKNNRKLSF